MSWIFGMGPQKTDTQGIASSSLPPTPLSQSTEAAATTTSSTPLTPRKKIFVIGLTPPKEEGFNDDVHKALTVLVEKKVLNKDIELSRIHGELRQKELKIMQLEAEKETMKSDFQSIADKLVRETKRQKDKEIKRLQEEKETLESNFQRINEEYRRKNIFGQFKTKCTAIGSGVHKFITDHAVMTTTVCTLSAVAVGWYIAKRGPAAAKYINPRLVQPSLIRETSRLSITDGFKNPDNAASQILRLKEDPLMNVQLTPYLESRFRDILNITKYTKHNNGLYRNIQFFGPLNTGKTVLARSLAYHSGLDFAVIKGSDIASKGKEGASALHEVFDWAESCRKGMVLYIDEVDAFLNHDPTKLLPEDRRAILNAFYLRTHKRSYKYMLVVASRHPEHFDWSLDERMDEKVELELPKQAEREKILLHYFEHYILKYPGGTRYRSIKLADNLNWKEKLQKISHQTEGLSVRELTKLVLDWQLSADATADGYLTKEMMDTKTTEALRFQQLKAGSRNINPWDNYYMYDNTAAYKRHAPSTSKEEDNTDIHVGEFVVIYLPLFLLCILCLNSGETQQDKKKSG